MGRDPARTCAGRIRRLLLARLAALPVHATRPRRGADRSPLAAPPRRARRLPRTAQAAQAPVLRPRTGARLHLLGLPRHHRRDDRPPPEWDPRPPRPRRWQRPLRVDDRRLRRPGPDLDRGRGRAPGLPPATADARRARRIRDPRPDRDPHDHAARVRRGGTGRRGSREGIHASADRWRDPELDLPPRELGGALHLPLVAPPLPRARPRGVSPAAAATPYRP